MEPLRFDYELVKQTMMVGKNWIYQLPKPVDAQGDPIHWNVTMDSVAEFLTFIEVDRNF